MDYSQKALDLFHQGYNCAQSVFAAFDDIAGLDRQQALALSSGFGAGIGRIREVCGAFSGLAMLCGVLKENGGRAEPGEREKIYALVQQCAVRFMDEFGSLYCRDLLGIPGGGPGGPTLPNARTPQYYAERPCERCVEFCARMGERLVKGQEP